jgi:hypothetical protein
MAEGLILWFASGFGEKEYLAVNAELGLDMRTGEGNWPQGLQSHLAGVSDDGFVVTEVWESKEAQAAFMESRLGPALAKLGLPHPSRVVWLRVLASQHPR